MTEWQSLPLASRVISLDRRRIPIRSSDRRPGPYPYYGASGIVDHVEGFLFEGLHLLVAEDGENLRSRKTPVAFLANGKFWVNNHAHVLQANADNDTRYLAYALEATDFSGYLSGSTQPKLTQKALGSVPINAPGLTEQQRIARTLGALDDKIDSNLSVVVIAQDLLAAIATKAATQLPNVPLGQIARLGRDILNPKNLGASFVDHYSLPAFDDGAVAERVLASAIMSNKQRITSASILVSRLNPRFNRTWWVEPDTEVESLASTEFAVLQAGGTESLAGLWLAVRTSSFRSEIARRVTGTSGSHQRIRPDDLLSIEVPDVRGLADETLAQAAGLLVMIQARLAQNQRLIRLRDALIPDLLSGRVRVTEVLAE